MGQLPRLLMAQLWSLYNAAVLIGLLIALGMLVANLACFDRLEPVEPFGGDAPLVSVLVPARNEARNIRACVESLLAQDYPNYELIVLDDQSEDETPELLGELGLSAADEGHRWVPGEALPEGWVGKNWACHQLALSARGDFLFFTDADTEHASGTISAAVAYALERRADLVSAWPRLLTATWSEKLVIPMILLGLVFYPHWVLRLAQAFPSLASRLPTRACRSLGVANGQFLLFTREGYNQIGGHAAVRANLVEDVALGRAVAARLNDGLRLFNCDALEFSTCRMYRRFGEVWEGFTKNVRPIFEKSLANFLIAGGVQIAGFFLPFVIFCFAPLGGVPGSVAGQIAVIYFIRILLTLRFRTSWLSCWLHPLGELFALSIALNSWRLSTRGGVSWKGRTYLPAQ